jgi:PAS domain S-box-containing protein
MARQPRAGEQDVPPEKRLSSLSLYLGLIPVLLLVVLIPSLFLSLQGHPVGRLIVDPPLLRPMLNTVFIILAACVVSYIAMRSYLLRGSSTVLLLGCGTLALGSGSFVASWLLDYAEPNAYVTVVNMSALLSSVLHVAGAMANVKEVPPEVDVTHRRNKLVAGYVGVLVLVALTSLTTVTGIMPLFFIQGAGPTSLREIVLMTALTLFIITSTSMMIRFIQERARFLYWYSMALALLALSMGGAFFQSGALGSLMGLLARIPLYVSGVYFFMAIISASREARTQNVSLNQNIAELFHKSEHKISFILASITDGYYELDKDWRFVSINERALAYFGGKREDFIGQLHPDVFPTVKGSVFEERYRKVFSDAELVHFEAQSVLRPGKWVETHAYPTEEGGIAVFFRDITARKEVEEAQRRSEEAALLLAQETGVMAEIGRIISSNLDIEEVYERFAEEVRKLIPFDRIVVNLIDRQAGTVTITYVSGAEIDGRERRDVFLLAGATMDEMVRTRAPLLLYIESSEEVRRPGLVLAFEAGLRSRLLVPLSARGEVIGGLSLWSKQVKVYGERDVRLAQSVANQIAGAMANAQLFRERRRAEEQIKASLAEKEILLKEVHHRVKNNLQIISSLLYLQSTITEHGGAVSALMESRARIKSMALIHERVYASADLTSVDMGKYTRNLVSDLHQSHLPEDSLIRLKFNLEDIPLGITEAIPCGLIINELVTNALKHAFPKGGEGEITIQLHKIESNRIALTVSDNGIGFPEQTDFRKSSSLGLTLINSLVEQLRGEIELDRSKGTTFTIRFG